MQRSMRGGSRPYPPSGRAVLLGQMAIAAFALHILLLFFPPLPPYLQGSIWSYLLGYGAVVLGGFALAPRVRALPGWWRAMGARRVVLGAACAAAVLALGLTIRALSPELFVRWTREEGVFEPLSVLTFVVAGMILLTAARDLAGRDRRFLQFFGGGFILLAFEEMDYFGVVGGIVGRVDGVYLGTPHDLIKLTLAGSLTPLIAILVAAMAGAVAAVLLSRGFLQPLRVLRMVFSPAGLWLWAGAVFFALGALEDARVWYPLGMPPLEELLEFIGAFLWLGFGLEVAARFEQDDGVAPEPVAPAREVAALGA